MSTTVCWVWHLYFEYTISFKPYKLPEIGSICFHHFIDEVTELWLSEITCVKSQCKRWDWDSNPGYNIFSQPPQVLVVLFCICCAPNTLPIGMHTFGNKQGHSVNNPFLSKPELFLGSWNPTHIKRTLFQSSLFFKTIIGSPHFT